jgi:hypothetical protein
MATVKLDPAKGVQIPNLTTTERNAISSPETGALIWNTTTSAINQYNGSAWEITYTDTNTQVAGITSSANATAITIDSNEKVTLSSTDSENLFIDGGHSTNASIKIKGAYHSNLYAKLTESAGQFIISADDGNQETNSCLRFKVKGTERMRLTPDGLTFNGDTAAVNALDDYEEGTHTATLTMGSGTASLSSNQLSYTKIGRVVHVSGQVRVGSVSSPDGQMQMSMPFTVASGNGGLSVGNYRSYQVDTPNDGVQAVIHSEPGQALATLQWSRDGSTPTEERATQNGYFMIGLTYIT